MHRVAAVNVHDREAGDVLRVYADGGGESFEDAQRRLREYIRKIPDLQWMTQYLGSSEAGGDQFRAMCWREVAERAMRAVGGQVQFLIDLALRVQLR